MRQFVPDADGADRLLVLHRRSRWRWCDSAQVTVTAQPVVDETRGLATVTADAAGIADAVLPFDGPDAAGAAATAPRSPWPATASVWPRRCSRPPSIT